MGEYSDNLALQSQATDGQISINKQVKIGGIETFGQKQISDITSAENKAKSNTEIFKDLL